MTLFDPPPGPAAVAYACSDPACGYVWPASLIPPDDQPDACPRCRIGFWLPLTDEEAPAAEAAWDRKAAAAAGGTK